MVTERQRRDVVICIDLKHPSMLTLISQKEGYDSLLELLVA
jgi:hypothetical protein